MSEQNFGTPNQGQEQAPNGEQPQQQGQPYQGQPYGQPYQGQPYQGQPYQGQPYQGQPYQGQPYQGQPYQGQPYQGQPYQGQPYQQGGSRPPMPKTYLAESIIVLICCCMPLAIVSLVKGQDVSSLYHSGHYDQAQAVSNSARTWVIVSFVLGIIMNLCLGMLQLSPLLLLL